MLRQLALECELELEGSDEELSQLEIYNMIKADKTIEGCCRDYNATEGKANLAR